MAGGRNKHPSTMGVLLRSEFSFSSLRPAPNGDSMCARYGTHRASNFPMIAFPCNRTVNWCLTLMGVSLLCWGGPKVFPRLPKQDTHRENNTARKSTFSTLSTTLASRDNNKPNISQRNASICQLLPTKTKLHHPIRAACVRVRVHLNVQSWRYIALQVPLLLGFEWRPKNDCCSSCNSGVLRVGWVFGWPCEMHLQSYRKTVQEVDKRHW